MRLRSIVAPKSPEAFRCARAVVAALGGLALLLAIAMPGAGRAIGPVTHLEFDLLHEELVGGAVQIVTGANPGEDGAARVDDLVFVNGVHGTHRVNLVAEVAAQLSGAPILRALGEHEYHLSGTNRGSDVWTLVDGDQLLRASLVDSLTVHGAPAGAYTIELYWDVHGFDDVLIDLTPGDSLYATLNTRVRVEARGPLGVDAWEQNVPWPSGFRNTDLDQRKTVDEYVVVKVSGALGSTVAVESRFEVEPTTRLDDFVEVPGSALQVDGEHSALFDQSAELIGVIVRDGAGNVLPGVTIDSASGFDYPVLASIPVAPLPLRTILSPLAVVDNTMGVFSASLPATRMIDHSGLDKPFTSAVTGFDTYFDFAPTPYGQANSVNSWQSLIQTTLPFTGHLDFDLGGTFWIDRIAIWNRSLEKIRVLISDSPSGPWTEIGQYTLQNRLFYSFSYPHEIIDLGGEYEADYLRLQVDSAYKQSASNTYAYGIVGELAVSAALTPLPEPGVGSMAMVGSLGAAALAAHRRRRDRVAPGVEADRVEARAARGAREAAREAARGAARADAA